MKKTVLTLMMLIIASIVFAQMPDHFNEAGTMYRTGNVNGFTYVLFDAAQLPANATANKVTLKRSLFTHPQTDLLIEVYNIIFDKKHLAVFSVMPSLLSKSPIWKKIDIDTLKEPLLKMSQLRDTMLNKFASYPVKHNGRVDLLKTPLYILIIRKPDGYYCSSTDCFTEFFEITDTVNDVKPACFRLNLKAKLLSVMEYESAYKRNHNSYSANYRYSTNPFDIDLQDNAQIHLSYIINDNNTKTYKFWLLDNWTQDGLNANRGMDRFVFKPGIGIVGAAYEFFMRDLSFYWYHLPKSPDRIYKGSEEEKNLYHITPYFQKLADPILCDYLTEDVINYVSIEKL